MEAEGFQSKSSKYYFDLSKFRKFDACNARVVRLEQLIIFVERVGIACWETFVNEQGSITSVVVGPELLSDFIDGKALFNDETEVVFAVVLATQVIGNKGTGRAIDREDVFKKSSVFWEFSDIVLV